MAESMHATRRCGALGTTGAGDESPRAPDTRVGDLCRTPAGTCGRCCHGPGASDRRLRSLARRHARGFRVLGASAATPWRLVVHEILARRGLDLFLAPALALPWVGGLLRKRFARRSVCAFLSDDDGAPGRVACLLHPERQGGRDVRARAAYRLLPGLACGDAEWRCAASEAWRRASPAQRARFARTAAGLAWPEYERVAARFDALAGDDAAHDDPADDGGTPCR